MKKLLFIFALIALLSACDASSTTSDTTPIDTPTPTINWQTTHTYNGSGKAMTETFTVGNHWKIKWSCDPNSARYGIYNFIVYRHKTPYNGDKSIPQADINQICASGNASGETEEMDVPNDWVVNIQEPK
jgi:hypothetical protein